VVDVPSRRVNFSLTAHPFKDELVMFGGQFYDGREVNIILIIIDEIVLKFSKQ
jgi:hypothetical protein